MVDAPHNSVMLNLFQHPFYHPQRMVEAEKWTLKQAQGDGKRRVAAPQSRDGEARRVAAAGAGASRSSCPRQARGVFPDERKDQDGKRTVKNRIPYFKSSSLIFGARSASFFVHCFLSDFCPIRGDGSVAAGQRGNYRRIRKPLVERLGIVITHSRIIGLTELLHKRV